MHFPKSFYPVLYWLPFFIFLSSCSTQQKAPQVLLSISELPQVSQSIQTLRDQAIKRQTLSGIVAVEIQVRGRLKQMQAAFRLNPPNQLSLNFLDDFGQSYARLEADGRQVEWWESNQESPQVYPQNGDVLKKIFGLQLSVQDLMDRLLLNLPETKPMGVSRIQKASQGGFRVSWPQGEAILATNPPQLLEWTGWNLTDQAKKKRLQYKVNYEGNFLSENNLVNYPDKISWLLFRPKASVTMEFSELE